LNIFLKILNEPIFYVISLIFSTRIFKGVFETYYIYHIFCFLIRIFKKIFKILFLLIFSHRVLGEDYKKTWSVDHNTFKLYLRVFLLRFFSYKFAINDIPYHFFLIFFPLGFKGVLMEYQHIYVMSKFSPIFPKGFKEFFPSHTHTSPDFSHKKFQVTFLIDYRITRRINWL